MNSIDRFRTSESSVPAANDTRGDVPVGLSLAQRCAAAATNAHAASHDPHASRCADDTAVPSALKPEREQLDTTGDETHSLPSRKKRKREKSSGAGICVATPQPFVSVLASAFRTVGRWCFNREEPQHIEYASVTSSGPRLAIPSDVNTAMRAGDPPVVYREGSVHERARLQTEDERVRSNRRESEQVRLGTDKASRQIRMARMPAPSRGARNHSDIPVATIASGRESEAKPGKLTDQPTVFHERPVPGDGSSSRVHHSGAGAQLDRIGFSPATHEHRQVGSLTESLADDTGHGLTLRRYETKRRAEDEKAVVQTDRDQAVPHPVLLRSPEASAAKTTSRAHEAMEHRFGESGVPDEAMGPMRPDSAPARTIRYHFKTWAGEPAVDIQTHGDRSKPEITVSTSDETVADALENRSDPFFAPIRRIRRDSDGDESPRRSRIYHTQDED